MKKPANLASALFIATALGLWACQHYVPNEKSAIPFAPSIASAVR